MKFSSVLSSVLTAAVVHTNNDSRPSVCLHERKCPEGSRFDLVNNTSVCMNCDSFESDGNGRFVCTKSTQSITVDIRALGVCRYPYSGHLPEIPATCLIDCPRTASTILVGHRKKVCYNCDEMNLTNDTMTCKKNGRKSTFLLDAIQTCGTYHIWIPKQPSPLNHPTVYAGRTCDVGYQSALQFQGTGHYKVCHNCEKFESEKGQISCHYKDQTFRFADSLLTIVDMPQFEPKLNATTPVCRTRQRCPAHAYSMIVGDSSVCFNCTNVDLNNTTFSCSVEGGERFTSPVKDIQACYQPPPLPPPQEKEAAVCVGDYECPEGLQPDKEGRSPICHNCDSFVQDGQLGSISGWFNCTRGGRESTFQQLPDCFLTIKPNKVLRASSPGYVCSHPLFDLSCPLFASSVYHDGWEASDSIGCHNCDRITRTESGVECIKDGKQESFDIIKDCPDSRGETSVPTIAPTDDVPGTLKPTTSPTDVVPGTLKPTTSPSLLPTEDSRASRPTPSNIPSAAPASVCSSFFLLAIPFLFFL